MSGAAVLACSCWEWSSSTCMQLLRVEQQYLHAAIESETAVLACNNTVCTCMQLLRGISSDNSSKGSRHSCYTMLIFISRRERAAPVAQYQPHVECSVHRQPLNLLQWHCSRCDGLRSVYTHVMLLKLTKSYYVMNICWWVHDYRTYVFINKLRKCLVLSTLWTLSTVNKSM